jgi:cell division protein FtsI (penicillin-binding protein 3)
MVKPIFVSAVKDHGRNIKVNETEILNSAICSKKTLTQLQALLEGVVEKGTAKGIYSDKIRMAGKTGTCQLNYWKGTHDYQASFAGYFPAEDPKYSCVVVINKPDYYKGYYGSTVAAPIFRAIANEIYLMTPVESEVEEFNFENKDKINIAKAEEAISQNFFPNLKGLNGAEAVQLLENSGYEVSVNGNGKVRSQIPKHGTALQNVYTVNLILE